MADLDEWPPDGALVGAHRGDVGDLHRLSLLEHLSGHALALANGGATGCLHRDGIGLVGVMADP